MKKNYFFFLIIICLIAETAYGQEKDKLKSTNIGKFGLGVSLGTTPGIDVSYQIKGHFGVKVNYNYFKYNANTQLDISDENIKLDGNFDMSAIGLALEYYPFLKSSFKLIGGVSYIQKGEIVVIASPIENYTFGESVFTPEEVGTFRFGLNYGKGVVPFVGIGFGRAVPKKRIGFGFELGTYYLKQPEVSLTGTERLSSMNEQEKNVQNNMNDWRYWPMLNLRLAVRLN